jgi:Protein of unknown function (DUF3071)
MQELRFVAVSEDGRYAVLAVPGRSARFTLPIDERLRAVALGQTSRLAQYEIEVESPLRPKEIQARIRAGETVEEIADAAGIAVERVRWFEGPVLAERAYMADQAQIASVRRHGDSTPGPRLGEIVTERLNTMGADPEEAQWDAKKRGDGSWLVQLTFTSGGRLHVAEWIFDPRRRHVMPADDNAARMSLPGAEPPQPAAPLPGEATVTQLAPRLGNARHERPVPSRVALSEPVPIPPVPVPPAPIPPAPIPAAPIPAAPIPAAEVPVASAPTRTPAPSRPVPPVPRRDVTEPTAWPRPASREPAPAPAPASTPVPRVAAEGAVREERPAAPPAAEAVPERQTVPERQAVPERQVVPERQAVPDDAVAQAEPATEQNGRPSRKAARGRRSSVPSWDEIMFGSSRQRD